MVDKVHCAHILVKSESEAKTVLNRLKKGEKFGNVARAVSRCPSGKKGGDLGTFTRGKMVKEFEQAVTRQGSGLVGRVIRTQFGFHIIKKTGQK